MTPPPAGLDRALLRSAGEHLGTLAERAKEMWELSQRGPSGNTRQKAYDRYARLSRLSREVLEVANG